MKRTERIAITRIISDLIKADNIIDAGEMDYYALLKEEYTITKEIEQDAAQMSLADAVSILGESDELTKKIFLSHCIKMTVSDGFCAPQEALLVMSIMKSLESSCEYAEVVSVPMSNFSIGKGQVLYVESAYDEKINAVIKQDYRTIDNEFRLAGFNFIYIPHIVKHYVQYRDNVFVSVAKFLTPNLTDEEIDDLRFKLTSMTTARFCREQLCDRLGMVPLTNTVPSLLIKVSDDIVKGQFYENFFRIDLMSDCLSLIRELMDGYVGMLSSDTLPVSHIDEAEGQFLYYGFYRLLFEMYTLCDDIQCTIEINPFKGDIRFPEINATLPLTRRKEKSFYMLMLVETAIHGGINFNQPVSARQYEHYRDRMKEMMKLYTRIYVFFGGENEKVPDLTKPEIRRPIISTIRKTVNSLQNKLHRVADYNIAKDDSGLFYIPLDGRMVKILTSNGFVTIDDWV